MRYIHIRKRVNALIKPNILNHQSAHISLHSYISIHIDIRIVMHADIRIYTLVLNVIQRLNSVY